MLYSSYRTVFHTILNISLVGFIFREEDAKIAFDKSQKGENRKLKAKTRIRRSIRAISPVISVLLMIAIAVAASLIAYAWIMGYIGGTTTKVGRAIQIQSMGKDPDNQNYLLVYVQNVGQGAVEFDPRNCAYIDDMLGTIGAVSPNPLAEGKTATIRVDLSGMSINADELIKVKVVTKDGTFSESKSNVPFSDMSSTYVLNLNVSPTDGGTVTPNPGPPYAPGTSVQLTANPNAGWIFAGWSGDLTGSTNPETIVMNGHKTVIATFTQTQIQYDVTFVLDSGGASMSPTPGVHTYAAGASVAISATPDGTHTFSQWTATGSITFDDVNAASTNAHINGAGTITATFNPIAPVLDHFDFSTISSPQTAGTAFSITITAKDASGNTFTSYTGTNTLTVSSGTISPTSTTAFTAGVWTGSVILYTSGSGITIGTTGDTKMGTSNGITLNAGTGEFGYHTQGSSNNNGDLEDHILGSIYTSPATSVTAQSITAYIQVSGTHTIKAAIYTSSGTFVAGTQEVSVTTSNDGWVTFTFASGVPLTANTDYLLVVWSNSASGSADLYYTSNGGSGRSASRTYATNWPNSPSFSSSTVGNYRYSIYCTYSIP
jgi:FlaG/FlaF family flagellin (archaellin)